MAAAITPSTAMRSPGVALTEQELGCLQAEFVSHVKWGDPMDPEAVTTTVPLRFSVGSFRNRLAAVACDSGEVVGLMIHFGADASKRELSLAYSFACMTLVDDEGEFTMSGDLLVTDEKEALVSYGGSLEHWRAGPGLAFKENILVDQYDDDRFVKRYMDEWGRMLYRASEIEQLIDDNGLSSTDLVEVVAVSEPLAWVTTNIGGDFTMRTCLVAVKDGLRRINNVPHGPGVPELSFRGADLGSACPPLCGPRVAFPTHGVAFRPGCK